MFFTVFSIILPILIQLIVIPLRIIYFVISNSLKQLNKSIDSANKRLAEDIKEVNEVRKGLKKDMKELKGERQDIEEDLMLGEGSPEELEAQLAQIEGVEDTIKMKVLKQQIKLLYMRTKLLAKKALVTVLKALYHIMNLIVNLIIFILNLSSLALTILIIGALVAVFGVVTLNLGRGGVIGSTDANKIAKAEDKADSSGSASSADTSGLTGTDKDLNKGTDGSWSKKGTKGYNNMIIMWKWWKAKGLTDEAVAGVLGNVVCEGSFYPTDRPEGYYGFEVHKGLGDGVPPKTSYTPNSYNTTGHGGGGHYQFTPYDKYAKLGDKKWKSMEGQNNFVYKGVAEQSWFATYKKETDVAQAARTWSDLFERPKYYSENKTKAAKQVYGLLKGTK